MDRPQGIYLEPLLGPTSQIVELRARPDQLSVVPGWYHDLMISLTDLTAFIVRAKAATYVGDGTQLLPSRPDSIDLQYHEGSFAYHDSYFGGSDFLGEEVVYCERHPVWAMNYHGYLLDPEHIDGATAGRVIKAALTAMYQNGRFLGGWRHRVGELTYLDESFGETDRFHGVEHIQDAAGQRLYELRYHGGLIRD